MNEVGRFYSMMSIMEVFWYAADSAIYTAVYSATLDYYPSSIHLVTAYICFCTLSGFLGIHLFLMSAEKKSLLSEAQTDDTTVDN